MSPYTYWITKNISDTCNVNEYTGALMHWYVDVDQLPLERWCIYNDSVYRAFQMEKDGFGRKLINVNFLHFYSLNFLLLLFDLLYMCQTNSHYLRITTRALLQHRRYHLSHESAKVDHIFTSRFTQGLTGW